MPDLLALPSCYRYKEELLPKSAKRSSWPINRQCSAEMASLKEEMKIKLKRLLPSLPGKTKIKIRKKEVESIDQVTNSK
ncbi:hypothetical protein P4123_06145 [Pseudomonas aeruginosa]|nr:hypothetical protein [Pseudomonas aeruginosa]